MMPREISAGAIIFRQVDNKPLYLLLHYPAMNHRSSRDFWDFPKGHIEPNESIVQTIRREVKEETAIDDLVFIRGYKETIKYFFVHQGQKIFKIVIFLLAQTQTEKVIISDEHCGFAWLPYDEAVKTVTFENSKQLLKKADVFVKKLKK